MAVNEHQLVHIKLAPRSYRAAKNNGEQINRLDFGELTFRQPQSQLAMRLGSFTGRRLLR
jgi:hypothetical protein